MTSQTPNDAVYIVEAVRTPIAKGRSSGSLARVHPVHLMAKTLDELTIRAKIQKKFIDDVIIGCVTQIGPQGANIARLATLQAGFPPEVPAVSLNRMCGSSQTSVHFGAAKILAGDADLVICGGIEVMSACPIGSDSDILVQNPNPEFQKTFPYKLIHQGESADLIAKKWNITRTETDDWAARSHNLAHAAQEAGKFDSQVFPINTTDKNGKDIVFSKDEGIRWPVNRPKLDSLKPYFTTDGVTTAGNASQLSDGASALLLASESACRKYNLKKRAKIITRVAVGCDPILMLIGPIPATQKALKLSGLSIDDFDVIEINEAFATVVLAWIKELSPSDVSRVNPNGGAIALGHPLGCTGELESRKGKYGLQTLCIGHGMGLATIIERCDDASEEETSETHTS